jgi:hypothetical protein
MDRSLADLASGARAKIGSLHQPARRIDAVDEAENAESAEDAYGRDFRLRQSINHAVKGRYARWRADDWKFHRSSADPRTYPKSAPTSS